MILFAKQRGDHGLENGPDFEMFCHKKIRKLSSEAWGVP
jgi:hypothetical protein